jgi:hypothetical protein
MDWTFADAASLTGARMTRDGYLAADARFARTGVQDYLGVEIGRFDMDRVRVWRPESEVFSSDAMGSFAHRPVTNDHPADSVSAENWKKVAVGQTGGDIARDGGFVRIPMLLMDKATIDAVQAGKRELSAGYTCDLDWTAGVTPEGQPYDAVQRNIRGNHIALVSAGRAGPQCRIGDAMRSEALLKKESREMSDTKLKTVVVDGIPIDATDQAAAVIESMKVKLADAAKTLSTTVCAHDAAIAAKDKELGAKDAEIAALKANQIDDAKIDALVAQRAAVVEKAKLVDKAAKTEGKSIPDIRRAAVVARLGDASVAGKSDDYVEALFDGLAAQGEKSNPLADAIRKSVEDGPAHTDAAAGQSAYQKMVDEMRNGWKAAAPAQQ